jgi:predicted ferric reductase
VTHRSLTARASGARRALPIPRAYTSLNRRDVWIVIGAIGVVIGAMWLRHDGLSRDWLTQVGELTALYGTYLALVGILFASRAPWLDQVFGADGLRTAHKWLGFGSVWLIGAHGVFSTLAYAGGAIGKVVDTLVNLVQTVPGMLGAVVGGALFVIVAVTSMRAARRRISYETWHGIHLYIYLAVAFAFLHQLTIGADFVDDRLATAFWVALYAAAFVPLFIHRIVWPVWTTYRFAPEVNFIEREGDGVVSLYVRGRNLDRLAARAGQFFIVRALTPREWMHGHPFSLSAAPNGQTLRFTYKEYGEGTRAMSALKPGTPLMLEGPYGAMHGARRSGRRLLFFAAGIGIAPMRAMAEAFRFKPGEADLIFRVRSEADAPLLGELKTLAAARGMGLHLILGTRPRGVMRDPVSPGLIRGMVPDAAERDVYLCGPESFMKRARSNLLAMGARPDRINTELFNA